VAVRRVAELSSGPWRLFGGIEAIDWRCDLDVAQHRRLMATAEEGRAGCARAARGRELARLVGQE